MKYIYVTIPLECASVVATLSLLFAMVRKWPLRSAVTIVVPLLFAVSQFANSFHHDVSIVYSGVFVAFFVGITMGTIKRQCTEFRAARLRSVYMEEE